MSGLVDKLLALLESRRFWVAVGGIILLLLQDVVGVDEQTAQGIIALLISWIVGDSLTKTVKN